MCHSARMTTTTAARTPRPERLYLLDAYLVRLLPTTEIAAECGVHHTTVMRWLAAEGIPRRKRNYAGRARRAA